MQREWSVAGLAVLICLAGCATLFFPWVEASVVTFDPTLPKDPPPKGTLGFVKLSGYQLWNGMASTALFLTGFVLLVITGPLRPPPGWRSVALLACGVAAFGTTVAAMAFPPEAIRPNPEAGRLVIGYTWGWAHLAAVALGGLLVLLAAIELRWWVARRIRERHQLSSQGQADPAAAPDRS